MLLINIDDIKGFVNKLLSSEEWGKMYLYEAEIKNAVFLQMDGTLNREFFDSEEEIQGRRYVLWNDIKGVFFQAIRGKRLPVSFKIVLMPDEDTICRIISGAELSLSVSDISALNLNIYYDRGELNVTTGTALKIFTLDKSLDYAWETYVKEFLKRLEIV